MKKRISISAAADLLWQKADKPILPHLLQYDPISTARPDDGDPIINMDDITTVSETALWAVLDATSQIDLARLTCLMSRADIGFFAAWRSWVASREWKTQYTQLNQDQQHLIDQINELIVYAEHHASNTSSPATAITNQTAQLHQLQHKSEHFTTDQLITYAVINGSSEAAIALGKTLDPQVAHHFIHTLTPGTLHALAAISPILINSAVCGFSLGSFAGMHLNFKELNYESRLSAACRQTALPDDIRKAVDDRLQKMRKFNQGLALANGISGAATLITFMAEIPGLMVIIPFSLAAIGLMKMQNQALHYNPQLSLDDTLFLGGQQRLFELIRYATQEIAALDPAKQSPAQTDREYVLSYLAEHYQIKHDCIYALRKLNQQDLIGHALKKFHRKDSDPDPNSPFMHQCKREIQHAARELQNLAPILDQFRQPDRTTLYTDDAISLICRFTREEGLVPLLKSERTIPDKYFLYLAQGHQLDADLLIHDISSPSERTRKEARQTLDALCRIIRQKAWSPLTRRRHDLQQHALDLLIHSNYVQTLFKASRL